MKLITMWGEAPKKKLEFRGEKSSLVSLSRLKALKTLNANNKQRIKTHRKLSRCSLFFHPQVFCLPNIISSTGGDCIFDVFISSILSVNQTCYVIICTLLLCNSRRGSFRRLRIYLAPCSQFFGS
jgi:hypothetical protein